MAKSALVVAAVAALAASSSAAHAATVVDVIQGDSNLSIFSSLLAASGLATQLSGAGPFTVFAPSDAAFANLDKWRVGYLKDPAHAKELLGVLQYHVAPASLPRSGLTENEHIKTLQGGLCFAEYLPNTTTTCLASNTCESNVKFVGSEMTASNGIVDVIDTVMMPAHVICPDSVFFVEQRNNSRVGYVGFDCRAKGTTELVHGEYKPVGLAVDSGAKKVFWSNDQNAKQFDSWLTSLDFSGADHDVFLNDLTDPQGMDVDTAAKKLYFTEHQGCKINRANYDGSEVETLRETDCSNEYPADVALDASVPGGLIFMAIQSKPEILQGKLAVMAFNGSNYKVLETGLIQNYGLCVDKMHKHVYYIQGGHGGSINCYPYGSAPCPKSGAVVSGLEYPYMCTVDTTWAPYGGPTTILFTEANYPGKVYRMNSDGTALGALDSELYAPMGVKLGCMASE